MFLQKIVCKKSFINYYKKKKKKGKKTVLCLGALLGYGPHYKNTKNPCCCPVILFVTKIDTENDSESDQICLSPPFDEISCILEWFCVGTKSRSTKSLRNSAAAL